VQSETDQELTVGQHFIRHRVTEDWLPPGWSYSFLLGKSLLGQPVKSGHNV